MTLNENVFKKYDIRGIYGIDFDKNLAYFIGLFLPRILKFKKIVIAKDARKSSNILLKYLILGLKEHKNIKIINLGLCSTPLFYFGVNYFKAGAGVIITASHNPKEFNGFKIVKARAFPMSYDTGIFKLKELLLKNYKKIKPNLKKKKIKLKISQIDLREEYFKYLKEKFIKEKDFFSLGKIILDFGNGSCGYVWKKHKKFFNIHYATLFEKPDGEFKNRSPDPFKDNLKDLKKQIKSQKAIFGVAFDADGDRIIFLDKNGKKIRQDIIGALISKYFLKGLKEKPLKILYDVRSIWLIPKITKKYKGKPILSRVGHSLIKEKMRKEKAVFASEFSGHFYFKDFFYCESSFLVLFLILKILKRENEKDIMKLIKKENIKIGYHSKEINFKVKQKQEIMSLIEKKYKKYTKKIIKLDGITMIFKDWYFNLRPSNTENLLRLNLEAITKKLLNNKIKELKKTITRFINKKEGKTRPLILAE